MDIFDEMDRLIDHKTFKYFSSRYWMPPTDIYETPHEILVYMEISGLDKKDITITYRNEHLFISGMRAQFFPESMSTLHQMEIETGRFCRKIKVGIDIVEDDIQAEYKEGILKVTIPKRS